MRKLINNILIIVLFFLPNFSFAQSTGGEEAMGFSKIVRNPELAGKGFAGAASTNSIAWSSFSNAASIPFSYQTMDVDLIYQHWAPKGVETNNIGVAFGYKFNENIGFSLGLVRQGGKQFEEIKSFNSPNEKFTPSDMQFNAGLGYKFNKNFSLGLNARYLSSSLSSTKSYSSYAVDLFTQYHTKGLNVALGLSNLGSSIKDSEGVSFNIPSSVELGLDYTKYLSELHSLNIDFDADYFFKGGVTSAIGLEYGYNDCIFVRAGYHYGTSKAILPSFATIGLGLRVFGAKLNIAYLLGNEYLNQSLTIGIGYDF